MLASSTLAPIAEPGSRSAAAPATAAAAYERSARGLYRFLMVRLGGDAHLADDFMQQLWLAGQRGGPEPLEEREAWLFGAARNLLRAHWRKQRRRGNTAPIAEPTVAAALADQLATEEVPTEALEQRETRDQLLLALSSLRSEDQELIVAHYFHGQQHEALAEQYGSTARAIEGRLYRARQALRQRLEHLSDEVLDS